MREVGMAQIQLAATCLVAAPLMTLAAMRCLTRCRGSVRRWLGWAAAVLIAALVLLEGGNSLLGQFGLTWRNGVALTLSLGILASGLAGVILTLLCLLPCKMLDLAPILRWTVKIGAAVCAWMILTNGLTVGLIFAGLSFGNSKRVVEYQGRDLVEEMDYRQGTIYYYYYEYHGALVRGRDSLDLPVDTPLGQDK